MTLLDILKWFGSLWPVWGGILLVILYFAGRWLIKTVVGLFS